MLKLVKKAQKGDDKAFLSLFQQYEQDIYRIAFVYVKNQNDALDVLQETAYRSFKTIHNLKEPKYFKTWLIRISINCSLDLLRKKEKVVQLKPELEEILPDDFNEDVAMEMTIRHIIEHLNEDEKSVVILRFYEDLTIKEVSIAMNIPLGTAKTILYRALEKLRNQLKGEHMYEK